LLGPCFSWCCRASRRSLHVKAVPAIAFYPALHPSSLRSSLGYAAKLHDQSTVIGARRAQIGFVRPRIHERPMDLVVRPLYATHGLKFSQIRLGGVRPTLVQYSCAAGTLNSNLLGRRPFCRPMCRRPWRLLQAFLQSCLAGVCPLSILHCSPVCGSTLRALERRAFPRDQHT